MASFVRVVGWPCMHRAHCEFESPRDGFNFVGLQQVPFICACLN